jgi:hypothetical protein
VPRNKEAPERFANYGLERDADERLTGWMHSTLTLIVWPMPASMSLGDLARVETDVIHAWTPPINLKDNPSRLPRLRLSRAVMAREAAVWAKANVASD